MSSSFGCAPAVCDDEHSIPAEHLVSLLGIRAGMCVANIGAGDGYYALALSRAVGPKGKVFAVECRPWYLDTLHYRPVALTDVHNVHVITGRACTTGLPSGSCDVAAVTDVWHHLPDQRAVLAEMRRILRPEGQLAILNWTPGAWAPPGPPTEHRMSLKTTLRTVELDAWSLVKCVESELEGYLLVFEVTDESVTS